ncbi:hypothetical protein J6590_100979 [Homalodisca vitripennis]|nr:hypothetical protein J6590_100979 [Homalodisca vitripennis]
MTRGCESELILCSTGNLPYSPAEVTEEKWCLRIRTQQRCCRPAQEHQQGEFLAANSVESPDKGTVGGTSIGGDG